MSSSLTIEQALKNLGEAIYGDDKTTLLNGLAFRNALNEVESSETEFELFLGDLDSFKAVNSQYGYAGGDAAIARTGQVLAAALDPFMRDHGVKAFRQGGDEFAVLAPTSVGDEVAKLLHTAFSSIVVSFKKAHFSIHGSFGRAKCLRDVSPEDWEKRAEFALSHAKKTGDVVDWSEGLKQAPSKLRARCGSCRAAFIVEPSKPSITESDLFCPQCGYRSTRPSKVLATKRSSRKPQPATSRAKTG